MKRYNKYSVFNFGMYKGYEVGLIFVVDPGYIEWCIDEITGFCITDLNELLEVGFVSQKEDQWTVRMVGEPEHNIHLDVYDSYDHIIEEVVISKDFYYFSDDAIKKNNNRI